MSVDECLFGVCPGCGLTISVSYRDGTGHVPVFVKCARCREPDVILARRPRGDPKSCRRCNAAMVPWNPARCPRCSSPVHLTGFPV